MNVLNPLRRVATRSRTSPGGIWRLELGSSEDAVREGGRGASRAGAARSLRAGRLSARALGRHAPARHDRARHDLPARIHHRGRADDRPRRDRPEGRARHDPVDPAARSAPRSCSSPTTWACTPILRTGSGSCMPAASSKRRRRPQLFARPLHPYSRHLIASLPRIGDDQPSARVSRAARRTSPTLHRAAASIRAARWPWKNAA